MPSFSKDSELKLGTCDERLQRLFREVIKHYDCTVIEGHRHPDRQAELYAKGLTKLKEGGKHNVSPSLAVDAGPYLPGRGIPWPQPGSASYHKDLQQWYHFVGFVLGTAKQMGISVRSGADWDRDHNIANQTFNDLPHFELC